MNSNIMAGGAGVEYYFGYQFGDSDLSLNDFRSRDTMWDLSRFALQFFAQNTVPFQTMANRNDLLSFPGGSESPWCLANDDEYVVYLRDGSVSTTINLPTGGYTMAWFDPRQGGPLGSTLTFSHDASIPGAFAIPSPPNSVSRDWTALIRKNA